MCSNNSLSELDIIGETGISCLTNYCKSLREFCALFNDDGTPYLFYVSIFSDDDPLPSYDADFNFSTTSFSNVSILYQHILLDTADSDVKVRKGVDKENAIVGGESQHKRVSTFKKMARLTTTAMGTPIRDPIEPIISTEQNTDTFPQKRALDDSSVHEDNLLVKRSKVISIDTSSGPAVGADDQPLRG